MIQYFKVEEFAHGGLDLLYPWIAKFYDFSTIHADEMIMLLKPIGFFVLGEVFAKLVLGDEVTTDQELEGVVHCSPADSVVGIFHVDIERFGIEVICSGVDLFEDRIPFRSSSEIILLQVTRED